MSNRCITWRSNRNTFRCYSSEGVAKFNIDIDKDSLSIFMWEVSGFTVPSFIEIDLLLHRLHKTLAGCLESQSLNRLSRIRPLPVWVYSPVRNCRGRGSGGGGGGGWWWWWWWWGSWGSFPCFQMSHHPFTVITYELVTHYRPPPPPPSDRMFWFLIYISKNYLEKWINSYCFLSFKFFLSSRIFSSINICCIQICFCPDFRGKPLIHNYKMS